MKSRLMGALGAIALMLSTSVNAAIMTFGNDEFQSGALGYTENGLTISNVVDAFGHPRIDDRTSSGEREFLFNSANGTIEFTLLSGGAFNLLSLDIEDPTINGLVASGGFSLLGSNGASITLDGSNFGTHIINGFTSIASFSLSCGDCQATVDNINFELASAVPIPAAAWLFGSGLLGLIGVARRKTQN